MNFKKLVIVLLLLTLSLPVYSGNALIPAPPQINASSYILVDHNSGQFLTKVNIDQKQPPASLTKIMTIYVVASELNEGKIKLDDMVTVSEKAWKMTGSRMFIEVNTRVSVQDLIRGVIIQSGNDASVALAEYISGDEDVFVRLMNQYTEKLGMQNTHFVNSSGLPDDQHYSTALDMAILATALVRDFPEIYAIHAEKEFIFNKIKQQNRNRLLWLDDSVDGIKTGHTEAAGFCLVASAQRGDMRLVSVVMGAESESARTSATLALLNYGFRFYETNKIYSADEILTTARIWKGVTDNIGIGLDKDLYVTVPRGQLEKLETRFDLPERLFAPVNKGDELGTMQLVLSDEVIISKPVFANNSVAKGNVFNRLKDDILLIFE